MTDRGESQEAIAAQEKSDGLRKLAPILADPDLFTSFIVARAIRETVNETKTDITNKLLRDDVTIKQSRELLAACLPFLRTLEAKPLRTRVIAFLEGRL